MAEKHAEIIGQHGEIEQIYNLLVNLDAGNGQVAQDKQDTPDTPVNIVQRVKYLIDTLESTREELLDVQSHLSTRNVEYSRATRDAQEYRSETAQVIQDLRKMVEVMRKKVDTESKTIADLKAKCEALKDNVRDFENLNSEQEDTIVDQEELIAELRASAGADNQKLVDDNARLQRELDRVHEVNNDMAEHLDEALTVNQDLKNQLLSVWDEAFMGTLCDILQIETRLPSEVLDTLRFIKEQNALLHKRSSELEAQLQQEQNQGVTYNKTQFLESMQKVSIAVSLLQTDQKAGAKMLLDTFPDLKRDHAALLCRIKAAEERLESQIVLNKELKSLLVNAALGSKGELDSYNNVRMELLDVYEKLSSLGIKIN